MGTPRPSSLFVNLAFLHLVLLSSISWAASPDETTAKFVQCMTSSKLNGILYAQNNRSFSSILEASIRNARLNTPATTKPQIIATPKEESHVAAAVLCAKTSFIRLVTRSGGHDYEGLSYISDEQPFVVLDMFNLRSITVDISTESAWVQSGATLGELYYAIWKASKPSAPYGYAAGICPTIGVGGHIGGGGYGNLLRKHGLAVDNILDAVVVNAEGKVLDRKGMGEDLFWAFRGGGGSSFGVLISYKVKLVSVPKVVTVFRIEKTLKENATGIVYDYQLMANTTVDDLFIRLLIQPISLNKTKTIRASFIALYLGPADNLVGVMAKDFPSLGVKKKDCMEMSWIKSVLYWANFEITDPVERLQNRTPDNVNFLKRKSDYLEKPISIPDLNLLWNKMIALGKTGLVFNPYGGMMGKITEAATPFPHRAGIIAKIQYSVNWGEKDGGDGATAGFLKQVRDLYEYTTPLVSKNPRRAFLNYRDLDIGINKLGRASVEKGSVYGRKYFVNNYERLVSVKMTVDPNNVFRSEQSIPATVPVKGGRRFP